MERRACVGIREHRNEPWVFSSCTGFVLHWGRKAQNNSPPITKPSLNKKLRQHNTIINKRKISDWRVGGGGFRGMGLQDSDLLLFCLEGLSWEPQNREPQEYGRNRIGMYLPGSSYSYHSSTTIFLGFSVWGFPFCCLQCSVLELPSKPTTRMPIADEAKACYDLLMGVYKSGLGFRFYGSRFLSVLKGPKLGLILLMPNPPISSYNSLW